MIGLADAFEDMFFVEELTDKEVVSLRQFVLSGTVFGAIGFGNAMHDTVRDILIKTLSDCPTETKQ